MLEEAEKVLKSWEGKDVNIYQVGACTSYRQYHGFDFYYYETPSGDYLVFNSQDEEVRFSVLVDEIYDVKVDEIKGEIIFTLHENGHLQVWMEIA